MESNILRRAFSIMAAEGWATYAESLMKEAGLLSSGAILCHLETRLWRAARWVVDAAIHLDGLPPEEGVKLLLDKTGCDSETAIAEVERIQQRPLSTVGYFGGEMAIRSLRETFLKKGGSLRDFHEAFLSCGTMPPAVAAYQMGLVGHKAMEKLEELLLGQLNN